MPAFTNAFSLLFGTGSVKDRLKRINSCQSMASCSAQIPLSVIRRTQSTTSAAPTRTFLGSHPRSAHVPPNGLESMTATCQPAERHRDATADAAAPVPITTRSNFLVMSFSQRSGPRENPSSPWIHGRLWATSNSGPGATFQFTLPIDVSCTSGCVANCSCTKTVARTVSGANYRIRQSARCFGSQTRSVDPDIRALAWAMLAKGMSELKKKALRDPGKEHLEDSHVDENMPVM